MIGRGRELGVLTGVWQRVVDEGRSHFVTVFGPSWIGKSRISLELAQLVAGQDAARAIRGRCTPYGASSPYSAFAQQVKQTARSFDSDETDEATEKLIGAIASLSGPAAAEEHTPNLAVLLGLDGDREAVDREQLFFSARVFVETLAMHGPTLLVYEDIHWADGSLLDLLEWFAARVRDVPVLFLALARPELLGERPGWGRLRIEPARHHFPHERLPRDHSGQPVVVAHEDRANLGPRQRLGSLLRAGRRIERKRLGNHRIAGELLGHHHCYLTDRCRAPRARPTLRESQRRAQRRAA